MGYYSDVRLTVSEEGFKQLYSFIGAWCEEHDCYDPLRYCDKLFHGDDGYLICWNDQKWYSDFPEVQAVQAGLKELEETNYAYSYCRLGEELGDVETAYHHSTRENEPNPENYMPGIYQHFDDKNIVHWCGLEDVIAEHREAEDLDL